VALCFVIDKRTVEISLLLEVFQIIAGDLLGIGVPLEGIDLPTGFTVVSLNHGFSLEYGLHSDHAGPLLLEGNRDLHALLDYLAGSFTRPHRLQFLKAAVRLDVLLDQIIDVLSLRLETKQDRKGKDNRKCSSDHLHSSPCKTTDHAIPTLTLRRAW